METFEKQLRIGVTGHRKLTAQQSARIEPLVKRAIDNIIFYHQNAFGNMEEIIFISSLAEGADTIFAHVALQRQDCKLKIILPFEKEEYVKDFDTGQLRSEFEFLLHHEKVSETVCVSKLDSKDRDRLYFEAGKKIVDDSDYIIAVWNEEKSAGSGGTGDVVEYATLRRKDILVINPLVAEYEIKGLYLPEFITGAYTLFVQDSENQNLVESFFAFSDKQAVLNRGSFDRSRQRCLSLGLIAALLFSAEFSFIKLPGSTIYPGIQLALNISGLLCIVIIAWMLSREKKKSFHEKYLSNRYTAERLRIDNLFFRCGYYPSKNESEIVHSYVADFQSLSPLIVINKFIQLCSYSNSPVSEKQALAEKLIREQGSYHRKRVEKLSKFVRLNSLMTKTVFIFFVALLILGTVDGIFGLFNEHEIFYSLGAKAADVSYSVMIFLFLSFFALMITFTAQKYFGEWQKLISQSEYMTSYLEDMSAKVNAAEEDRQLRPALNALNENIYIENLEWEMFMLNKNEMMIYRHRKLEHAKRTEIRNEKFAREVLNTRLEIQQQTMQDIGREIHDNIGQKLVLASLYMQQLEAEKNSSSLNKINAVAAIIDESLADLRSMSRSLAETVSPHTGLYELMNNECKKINGAGSCNVLFESDLKQIDLSQGVKNVVLRILQEFLQNSLKHAACTEIKVSLHSEEAGLTLNSVDNGKGFVLNGRVYEGIGLKNIRKRAEIIGADLLINSAPGQGTRMKLFIPSHKLNA